MPVPNRSDCPEMYNMEDFDDIDAGRRAQEWTMQELQETERFRARFALMGGMHCRVGGPDLRVFLQSGLSS